MCYYLTIGVRLYASKFGFCLSKIEYEHICFEVKFSKCVYPIFSVNIFLVMEIIRQNCFLKPDMCACSQHRDQIFFLVL
jgi:hypothetical protein